MAHDITPQRIIDMAKQTVSTSGSVDVTKLAHDLNIHVYEYKFNDGISGAVTKKENGEYSIFVSDKDPLTRKRFSIAHELAHFVLHQENLANKGIMHRDNADTVEEIEANELAEQILMPDNLVSQFLETLDINQESIIGEKIIQAVAAFFKVSKYVALIRLRNLEYNIPYIYYA